jgi:hypothetical protein
MTIALVAKAALVAARPAAIFTVKAVGIAVGYGALCGVTYGSIRVGCLIADKAVDALDNKMNDTAKKRAARERDLEAANRLLRYDLQTHKARMEGAKEYASWTPKATKPSETEQDLTDAHAATGPITKKAKTARQAA